MDSATLASVRTTLDTLLFEQIFKPLAQSGDSLGDYEVAAFAHTLAERLGHREH